MYYICTLRWRNVLFLRRFTRSKSRCVWIQCSAFVFASMNFHVLFWICFCLGRFGVWCGFWKIILKVKEWLQNLGIGDHMAEVQVDDEGDDDTIHVHNDEIVKSRWLLPRVLTGSDGHKFFDICYSFESGVSFSEMFHQVLRCPSFGQL